RSGQVALGKVDLETVLRVPGRHSPKITIQARLRRKADDVDDDAVETHFDWSPGNRVDPLAEKPPRPIPTTRVNCYLGTNNPILAGIWYGQISGPSTCWTVDPTADDKDVAVTIVSYGSFAVDNVRFRDH